jgi:hypothetical protein
VEDPVFLETKTKKKNTVRQFIYHGQDNKLFYFTKKALDSSEETFKYVFNILNTEKE